jgi:hypothetical protein
MLRAHQSRVSYARHVLSPFLDPSACLRRQLLSLDPTIGAGESTGMASLRARLLKTFGFLTDAGFSLEISDYRPDVFGNYVAIFAGPDLQIRLVSDRSQVFVEIREPGGHWCDKEMILEQRGIPRARHPLNEISLWSGYREETQARDLQEYLSVLKSAAGNAGQ